MVKSQKKTSEEGSCYAKHRENTRLCKKYQSLQNNYYHKIKSDFHIHVLIITNINVHFANNIFFSLLLSYIEHLKDWA